MTPTRRIDPHEQADGPATNSATIPSQIPAFADGIAFDAEDEAIGYLSPERSGLAGRGLLIGLMVLALMVIAAVLALTYRFVFHPTAFADGAANSGRAVFADGSGETGPPPIPVEPVELLDVPEETARKINADIPFTDAPVPAAAPFLSAMSPADYARAVDCLGAAVWYEAGDDALGQQSVAQVVLNRMRNRSFPNTVCGVVFQGSDRRTGCQFTFTCDGAMLRRRPTTAAWDRARAIAASAMQGFVFNSVGWATHYHTDWVVPNWARSVDKVAKVRTHLFYRWQGANGRPPAFRQGHGGSEPTIVKMRALSPAHDGTFVPGGETAVIDPVAPSLSDEMAVAGATQPKAPADLRGNDLAAADTAAGLFVVEIEPQTFSGSLALMANDMCRARRDACTVVGYVGKAEKVIPRAFGAVRWQGRTPDFYYAVDRSRGREQVLWNCATYTRPDPSQCIPTGFSPGG